VSGVVSKRGGILQELDIPTDVFLKEMSRRGVQIRFSQSSR
jgi:hypothetical protein